MTTAADLISAAQPQTTSSGATAATLMAGAGFSPDDIAKAPAIQSPTVAKPSSMASRVFTGLQDPMVGTGQLLQHAQPEMASNFERSVANVPYIGLPGQFLNAASGGNEATTSEVDETIAKREKAYQTGRAAAGSVGFDWMRTLGNAANPINYAIPGGGASSAIGRIAGAAGQGGTIGAMQPVIEPGNFWGEKLKQSGLGALVGGVIGSGIEAISGPLTNAARKIGSLFANPAENDAAAQGVIDSTLAPTGIKTTDLPPEMVDGLMDQVKNSMRTGDIIDPVSLRSQAEAASLPIPIKLPRGQASGNAGQYAIEQELAKILGKGDDLRTLMSENNTKLMGNLDAIGAAGAPTGAQAGVQGLTTMANIDKTLDTARNAAYSAVKDSSGRSASLDVDHFYVNAMDALNENMSTLNNPGVLKQLDDISTGKLPLNVSSMVQLDKAWGRIQRTTSDGNEQYAMGLLRSTLADTPVAGDAGADAVKAYQYARGLAKQQFSLADPKDQNFIPAYASMLKGMGNNSQDEFVKALQGGTANLDPEKWFNDQVMKATPAAAKKLMAFLGQAGDEGAATTKTLQGATLGAIKDSVVKGNNEVGRAVFSNDAMSKVMDRSATLQQILPSATMDQLGRLYNTSSRISGVPYKAPVNWSNTAATNVNLQTMKEGAETIGRAAASLNPVTRSAVALKDVVTDLSKKRAQTAAAQAATQPLYTTPGPANVSGIKTGAYRAAVPLSSLLGARYEND